MKKATPLNHSKIACAALHLVASEGWGALTIKAVAKRAKVSEEILKKRFPSPDTLVTIISEEIDREAFTPFIKISDTSHDKLFDLLMRRFDVLQKYRTAILSMADAAPHNSSLSCALARATLDSIYRLIEKAEIKTPRRLSLAAGFMVLYGWVFYIWRKDITPDMAKTMAALDRALRLATHAMNLMGPKAL